IGFPENSPGTQAGWAAPGSLLPPWRLDGCNVLESQFANSAACPGDYEPCAVGRYVVGHVHHPYDSSVLFEAKDMRSDRSPPACPAKLRKRAHYRRALPAPLIQPGLHTANAKQTPKLHAIYTNTLEGPALSPQQTYDSNGKLMGKVTQGKSGKTK